MTDNGQHICPSLASISLEGQIDKWAKSARSPRQYVFRVFMNLLMMESEGHLRFSRSGRWGRRVDFGGKRATIGFLAVYIIPILLSA